MSQTFSFPLLKTSDIVSCSSELGIPLTAAHLADPSEEVVRAVLERLLELLKGSNREEMKQIDFAAMEMMPYPELHDEGLVEFGLLKHELDLCLKTGVYDITLGDLVQPEKGRLRRILSALINFAKFREDKLEHFTQHTQETQRLIEVKATLEMASDDMEIKRNQMAAAHVEIAPQLVAVQTEVEELKATVNNLVSTQSSLREEIKTVKQSSSHVAEKISERVREIESLETENTRLKSQIVHEPEKLKAKLKEMTAQVTNNREDASTQSSKLKHLNRNLSELDRLEEKLQARLEMLRTISNEQQALARLRKQVADASNNESDLRQQLDEFQQQEDSLKENISCCSEKLYQLQTDFESKRVTATHALQQVTQERDRLATLVSAARSQNEQNESIMLIKRQQLQALTQDHARTMNNLKNKYQVLQQTVKEYHEKLAMVMEQAGAGTIQTA